MQTSGQKEQLNNIISILKNFWENIGDNKFFSICYFLFQEHKFSLYLI